MKFVYITHVLSVTVTVVTVKKMTIMTNDSVRFSHRTVLMVIGNIVTNQFSKKLNIHFIYYKLLYIIIYNITFFTTQKIKGSNVTCYQQP